MRSEPPLCRLTLAEVALLLPHKKRTSTLNAIPSPTYRSITHPKRRCNRGGIPKLPKPTWRRSAARDAAFLGAVSGQRPLNALLWLAAGGSPRQLRRSLIGHVSSNSTKANQPTLDRCTHRNREARRWQLPTSRRDISGGLPAIEVTEHGGGSNVGEIGIWVHGYPGWNVWRTEPCWQRPTCR